MANFHPASFDDLLPPHSLAARSSVHARTVPTHTVRNNADRVRRRSVVGRQRSNVETQRRRRRCRARVPVPAGPRAPP